MYEFQRRCSRVEPFWSTLRSSRLSSANWKHPFVPVYPSVTLLGNIAMICWKLPILHCRPPILGMPRYALNMQMRNCTCGSQLRDACLMWTSRSSSEPPNIKTLDLTGLSCPSTSRQTLKDRPQTQNQVIRKCDLMLHQYCDGIF